MPRGISGVDRSGAITRRVITMSVIKRVSIFCLILVFASVGFAADVILSEYNAVDNAQFLNGGTAVADSDGERASDVYFGRALGNGRDWFEMVVITDHLNMQNWKLDIYQGGSLSTTLDLTGHSIWSDLRSGTIITVAEDVPSDISYNPSGGDWWINVQASNDGDGLYIEAVNFPVSSDDWQLEIKNSSDVTKYGPAGEGVYPASGVNDMEIFRLEADPSASILRTSVDYDDASSLSTFGTPNQWGGQKFGSLRGGVVSQALDLTVTQPEGVEVLSAGSDFSIIWGQLGTIENIKIEFSIDNGDTWAEVYPPNTGNTGSYNWLVPAVDSESCRVRVSDAVNPAVNDRSGHFTIYTCSLAGDLTGNCGVNLADLSIMAAEWLDCANPYDLSCIE